MPELPEVETIINGLRPYIHGAEIERVIVRCQRLRWPIPEHLDNTISKQTVQNISRRGKYLLIQLDTGTIIIHLGMSGRLCIVKHDDPPKRHDHLDIVFTGNRVLRYTDPRRFGAIVWTTTNPLTHFLLKNLGLEPLTDEFTGEYLLGRARNRRISIKPFIMDGKIVVGIGNIYAAEALFLAGIHPSMPAGLLTKTQSQRLVQSIKQILNVAIIAGGTTLKDFVNSDGMPGYFAQQLNVYGRRGKSCVVCHETLQSCMLGQRSTVFCGRCQAFER